MYWTNNWIVNKQQDQRGVRQCFQSCKRIFNDNRLSSIKPPFPPLFQLILNFSFIIFLRWQWFNLINILNSNPILFLDIFMWKEISLCHKLWFSNPISLQPNVVERSYFKIWTLLDQIIIVWLIKDLGCIDKKHFSLWQRLNSFDTNILSKL